MVVVGSTGLRRAGFHQVLLSHLRMGAEGEERSQQEVCYRTGDEAGGLDLEKRGR